jgi:hypothetical protein
VNGNVSVSFLISVVFGNVVKVVAPHHDRPLHFGGNANAFQNFAANGNVGGERTFLIDVLPFDGFLRSFEAQSDVLEIADAGTALLGQQFLTVQKDVLLFLESSFVLRYRSCTWMSAIAQFTTY